MVKKALDTGNEVEVEFEDLTNSEAEVSADMSSEVTQAGNGDTPAADEQTQADLEAAGVNVDAQDEKRAKNRQKKALLKKIGDIGEAFGAGQTSMIELAAEVTEAAVNKTVGESDAEDLYKTFKARAVKRATTDAGLVRDDEELVAETLTQQVSKVRTFIRLGNGMEEAVDIVQRAIGVHLSAKSANSKAVMKGSTYTVLGSIVTEQLRDKYAGVPMTDEQMHAHIAREVSDSGPATAATKVRQALDSALSAQKGSTGEKSYRAPLVSPNLEDAIDALYRALGDASPAAQAEYDKEVQDKAADEAARETKKAERAAKKKAA